MKVSNDVKERLKIGALWLFQSYKVIMGSLLILFVPQKCEELVDNSGSSYGEYETVICSISDNLHKTDDTFHNITLGFKILKKTSYIAFGICDKNLMIKHNYSNIF